MACIFCAIAAGSIPSHKVHEDEHTFGFLDINPLAQGHALVIPKTHVAKLEDCPPTDAAALMAATQALIPRLCSAVQAQDATVAINDGPDAGQEVPHLHIHIIPRRPGDAAGPIHALFNKRPTPDGDVLAELAQAVTA